MGNTPSVSEILPPKPVDENEAKLAGIIIGSAIGFLVIIAIILAFFYFKEQVVVAATAAGVSAIATGRGISTVSPSFINNLPWGKIIPVFLGIMSIVYFSFSAQFALTKGKYRSNAASYNLLIMIQENKISTALGSGAGSASSGPSNGISITRELTKSPKTPPLSLLSTSSLGMVNWRPLTVRLPGYLGGETSPDDGVFSMAFGINAAISYGARGFFFDIDYEDANPCTPVIIFRDDSGVKRSLNNGSITDGIKEIASKVFVTNYDPVLIFIYLRRIPENDLQKTSFFRVIARALSPISEYHLGHTDKANFHNCRSESILFSSPITDFQKKIIVMVNYNTTQLPSTKNPKDNLDFWNNARIYEDPSGKSAGLGSVTGPAPSAPPAVALIGHTSQLLNIGVAEQTAYRLQSQGKFSIAIGSPNFIYTPNQVATLINTLGIQCVPLDVITLGISTVHNQTITYATRTAPFSGVTTLSPLHNFNVQGDILSLWTYTGWSRKNVAGGLATGADGFQDYKEGFEDELPVPPSKPIAGFITPKPAPPKMPSAKMNSNGGLVSVV
jgi:hypothetical protein